MNCIQCRHTHLKVVFVLTCTLVWTGAIRGFGAERIYTIVTAQSSIAISGTVAGATIQTQGAGSLTTTYSGTIRADRGANTIDFLSTTGTPITANNSGSWQPLANGAAGSAQANYGGFVSLFFGATQANFAGRNFQAELSSSVLNVGGGGTFPISTVDWNFLNSSSVAYRVTGIGAQSGSQSIAGQKIDLSGNGTLSVSGLTETLTIPVVGTLNLDLNGVAAVVNFNGQIRATAMIPEPSAVVLGFLGGLGLMGLAWRRRHAGN